MANFKYFNGDRELRSIVFVGGSDKKASNFIGYPEGFAPVFVVGKGWSPRIAADRIIEIKSNPSRHECDARCLNATGRVMKCECSCGGKNHGRGSMICEAA